MDNQYKTLDGARDRSVCLAACNKCAYQLDLVSVGLHVFLISSGNSFALFCWWFTVYVVSAGHSTTRLTPCMSLRGNGQNVAPFS